MRFIHLSDLHLGKRVNGFSMLQDQEYILQKIIEIIKNEQAEAVLIAGDIYDKAIPPAEAVCLFDSFLTELSALEVKILMISGNHDSAERLSFASRLLNQQGIYLTSLLTTENEPVILEDEYGQIAVYLMPFVKPALVRAIYPEENINSYQDAVQVMLNHLVIDTDKRNILVAHQFVTGAECCDSEELAVGGLDNIDVNLFAPFDYVALGHIHKPQKIGRETVRYSGTPLKYSFSETKHHKSVTIVDVLEKGKVEYRLIDLKPQRDMREIRGKYMEVTALDYYKNSNVEDYLHITLTDEEDILDGIGKLRSIYPNIMLLDYDNKRTQAKQEVDGADSVEEKTPLELFDELYYLQNNSHFSSEQREYLSEMIEKIWEGEQ